MNRVFNFSPGPSMLPVEVLRKAKAELLDWNGSGMSVMEISHRGKEFVDLAARFEARLKKVLSVPDNYRVLYLSGGATGQFAGIPLNLRSRGRHADYIISGQWGKKAALEAGKFIEVRAVADTLEKLRAPHPEELKLSSDAAYTHYTPNETIIGVEFPYIPETGSVPLVGDCSSQLLSKPIDVKKYGVIYACTQKNIGPAGTAIVIVREDLINDNRNDVPAFIDWRSQSKNQSMYNTPATFNWYLSDLVIQWVEEQGGVKEMEKINRAKAQLLYDYIDNSDWYHNPIPNDSRSCMNVPFTLPRAELDSQFLVEANRTGLTNLKGHRSIGGMRASIYNSMPLAGVQTLVEFMVEFARRNG